MGPVEALRSLRHAIDDQEWTNAVGALNNYYQWRLKGGYEPTVRWMSGINAYGDSYADTLANELQDKMP